MSNPVLLHTKQSSGILFSRYRRSRPQRPHAALGGPSALLGVGAFARMREMCVAAGVKPALGKSAYGGEPCWDDAASALNTA